MSSWVESPMHLTIARVLSLFQPQNWLDEGKEWNLEFSQFILLPQRSTEQPPDTDNCVITCLHFCFELTANKGISLALKRSY